MVHAYIFYWFSVIFILTALLNNRRNLLTLLLTIEGILLVSIGIYSIGLNNIPVITILTILCFAACETSLALSVLSTIVRHSGSDNVKATAI